MNSSIRRIPHNSGSKIDASLRASAHTGVAIPWIFLECSGALVGATIGRPFSFLNPFFFLLLRKKRMVSIFHEKKESNVPTVVLNLTQKISAISCPSRPSLPPERSLRSARAFRRCLPCDSSTAPVHRRSGLPTPPGKVSAKQTDEGREAVAVHHCNLRPSTAPAGADDSVRPLLPRSSAPKGTLF